MKHPRLGEVDALVRGAAALAPFRGADSVRWRVIPGGAVNLRLAVETVRDGQAQRWFLRLAGAAGSGLGAALGREATTHGLAADAGLAPPLVEVDVTRGTLVTAWIDARPWTWRRARTAQGLRQFAALAAALHELPVPRGVESTVPAEAAAALLDGDKAREAPRATALVHAALAAAQAAAQADAQAHPPRIPAPAVLAHFDPHAGNLLQDTAGRLWLVDFEYAAAGTAVDDLAAFATAHDLTAAARRDLLAAYVAARQPGAVTPTPESLDVACLRADALWMAWTLAVHGAAWRSVTRARRVAARLRYPSGPPNTAIEAEP